MKFYIIFSSANNAWIDQLFVFFFNLYSICFCCCYWLLSRKHSKTPIQLNQKPNGKNAFWWLQQKQIIICIECCPATQTSFKVSVLLSICESKLLHSRILFFLYGLCKKDILTLLLYFHILKMFCCLDIG